MQNVDKLTSRRTDLDKGNLEGMLLAPKVHRNIQDSGVLTPLSILSVKLVHFTNLNLLQVHAAVDSWASQSTTMA